MAIILIAGCNLKSGTVIDNSPVKSTSKIDTLGEISSGYGYIPLDGLPITETLSAPSCNSWASYSKNDKNPNGSIAHLNHDGLNPFDSLLNSLPDVTVRFAVAQLTANGGFSFGPAKVTAKGSYYRAILDYINVDVIPVRFKVTAIKNGDEFKVSSVNTNSNIYGFSATMLQGEKDGEDISPEDLGEIITFPVYVGIGMRLTSDVKALEGDIALTSLGIIGANAAAKNLIGTFTVQSIGVSGKLITTPLPSSIDQTSIENGIMALATNRANIYNNKINTIDTIDDNDKNAISDINLTPRIVGLYSPIGSNPNLVNAIYSELSSNRPKWSRPCKPFVKSQVDAIISKYKN